MLEALRISNFAIIDKLEVEFDRGLTVITGETGAGKSIVLGAFRLLLGERAMADVVRHGSARAGIEGIFGCLSASVLTWLQENGFGLDEPDEAEHLILRRDILQEGPSRNFINGRASTVAQLRELGALLVDMHGQQDHTRLYSPAIQLQLLDSYGDYANDLNLYQLAFRSWREARMRYDTLTTDQGDEQRRRDFLQFQVDEILQAELRIGEDEELEQEKRRLANAERLQEICSVACDILYEGEVDENPAGAKVSQAAKLLTELAALDPSRQNFAVEAEEVRFALEDLSEKIRDYTDSIVGDPQRLDQTEVRLELLRTLKRKYGPNLEAVISTGEKLSAELDDIVNHDAALTEAIGALGATEAAASASADKLTKSRIKAARLFEKQVESNMKDLELQQSVLKIDLQLMQKLDVQERRIFQESGQDVCEFMVSLNAGEMPKPMRKVASGGEVSRIMLAIKSVLAGRDDVMTLVFDEIDTGISGKAAGKVGERLEKLSASNQVIAITHLPQVAARGSKHLVVEKTTINGRTVTGMQEVQANDRTMALARMLSGTDVDETTRKFAEKLLVKQD